MSDKKKKITSEDTSVKSSYTYISSEDVEMSDNFRVISPGRMVAKRFFRSKLSIVGIVVLAVIFIFSFIGPIIVDVVWTQKGWISTPNDRAETMVFNREYKEGEQKPIMFAITRFKGADGNEYTFYDRSETNQQYKAPATWDHILGTDTSGMDIFVRLMYGGRISLTLSFLVVFLETLLGVILGGISGYYGGWVDQLIMRIVDIFNCLPGLPILLILSSIISTIPTISNEARIYYVMGVLCLMGWAGSARLVRGQILMLREQEYMMAAEATGLPSWRKILKHLIPNVMPQLIVSMTLGLGGIILYESTLSYLSLGVPFPNAAWGSMIALADPSRGQEILAYYPNMWVPAGILIVATVLAFNFVGDGLRDAFDPRMKR